MTKTFLVVDDSRLSRIMIRSLVEDEYPEWKIFEAADSVAALKIAKSNHIDIATIDMNMPGVDGITLGVKLRKRFPDAKLSILTANVQKVVRERVVKSDLGFIGKPVTKEKIHAFILEVETC